MKTQKHFSQLRSPQQQRHAGIAGEGGSLEALSYNHTGVQISGQPSPQRDILTSQNFGTFSLSGTISAVVAVATIITLLFIVTSWPGGFGLPAWTCVGCGVLVLSWGCRMVRAWRTGR
jgi:hypothetical protein